MGYKREPLKVKDAIALLMKMPQELELRMADNLPVVWFLETFDGSERCVIVTDQED